MKFDAMVLRKKGTLDKVVLSWRQCVAIGYAGRDQKNIIEHIEELKALGVPAPSSVPSLYWIDPTRISCDKELFVIGNGCSGEVEVFVACDVNGAMYFSVASDHTDRNLETISVSKAKQCCSKIVGSVFWSYEDVAAHWDKIELHSWVRESAELDWRVYQNGTLGMILPPEELLGLAERDASQEGPISYFSGTIPLLSEISYHGEFKMELLDPILNRSIIHHYRVVELPDRN